MSPVSSIDSICYYAAMALLVVWCYASLLQKLRKLSWASMTANDPKSRPPVVNGIYHQLDDLFRGIASSSGGAPAYPEGLYFILNQYPVYMLHAFRILPQLPYRIIQMMVSKLRHGYFGKKSERDVVDLILSIPCLYMMCKYIGEHGSDDQILRFVIPKGLPGNAFEGDIHLSDLELEFLKNERRILRVKHEGRDLDARSSSNLIFSIVFAAGNNWSHFKSHLMAEKCADEIVSRGIYALEPSSRFVEGLHSGLLNGALSPAVESSPLYAVSVTRECFEERFRVQMPHYIDASKRSLPGFRFLFAARMSIAKHLKIHGFEISAELLFQNMVVHSVDHYYAHEYLTGHNLSCDGSETFMSYIRGFLFTEFWTPAKVNPIDDVRLCAVAKDPASHPFYRDVYNDLRQADPVLADVILASTSF